MDLYVFDSLLKNPVIAELSKNAKLLPEIIRFGEQHGVTDNSFREYISFALADNENALSYTLMRGKKPGADLIAYAMRDIEKIYDRFYDCNIKYSPSDKSDRYSDAFVASLKNICESKSPEDLFLRLSEHYSLYGTGVTARYAALRYDDKLIGIVPDKSVTFDTLIGLEYQKKIILENTLAFTNGKPANNILLSGDRGTGKSSCIKAVLNELSFKPLCMVEIPKSMIINIPKLTEILSRSPKKFILYLDDLSFDSADEDYKALKIAMEGQLSCTSENILIYATSNRRHLIRESMYDRGNDDVHRSDAMQETLSLSERFGINLVFTSPNQKEYLNLVKELLLRRGIEYTAGIEQRALIWQMNAGNRNPRLAKQFVASVSAER